jgi:hypothetical protein
MDWMIEIRKVPNSLEWKCKINYSNKSEFILWWNQVKWTVTDLKQTL